MSVEAASGEAAVERELGGKRAGAFFQRKLKLSSLISALRTWAWASRYIKPAINSEVQRRRSAISVVRPVRLAGESRRRGGGGVRRKEGVARANAPAAAKNLPQADARRGGTAQLSGSLRLCARTPTAPAGRPGYA